MRRGLSEAVVGIDRRQHRDERAPHLLPRLPLAPRRRNLPHQPVQADGLGRDRRIALVRDRLAVHQRESAQRRQGLLEAVVRERAAPAARRIFRAPRRTGTAGSAPARAARRGRSAARRRGGAWRPPRSRARRSSPPSGRRDTRRAHRAQRRAAAPARPRSALRYSASEISSRSQ